MDECKPLPRGQYFSSAFESDLADGIRYIRERKLPVFKPDVMRTVRMALIENDAEELLSDLTDGCYRGFLRRTGLGTGNQSPIETTRAAWLTPANLEGYYDVAAEMLVDAGIAHRVEGFDRAQAYAVMLIIDHPERMLSYDETDLTLDQTGGSKSNSLRTITSGKGDYGETTATKSGKKVTGTGAHREQGAGAVRGVWRRRDVRRPVVPGQAGRQRAEEGHDRRRQGG